MNEVVLDTIVEWTLEPKENGTELNLFHHGFKEENHIILASMFDGWNNHIQKMFQNLITDKDASSKS